MRKQRLLAIATAAGTVFAIAVAPGAGAAPPSDPASAMPGALQLLSSSGSQDVWAGGWVRNGTDKEKHQLYRGGTGSWARVTGLPRFTGGNQLVGLDAVSPRDVWALALQGNRTFALHWDGTSWTKTRLPVVGRKAQDYTDIDEVAPGDVWACGTTSSHGGKVLMARFDGRSWHRVAVPGVDGNGADVLSMASADDGWATLFHDGAAGHRFQLLHWNGSAWSLVGPRTGPNGVVRSVRSVVDISPSDAWAGTSSPNLLHWDGSRWSDVPFQLGDRDFSYLEEVAASGSGDVWAAGTAGDIGPVFEHWDGSAWTQYPTP
ncbi:MAG: hypothetical protein INR72_15210, partial [Williamsia herbipolensis]|nr:hypothetical protein [Williamsia herbipolensis]